MGNILFAKNHFHQALNWFRLTLSIHPDSESAIYYLAVTNEKLGNHQKALKYYKILLEKNPHLADAAWRYKNLLITIGKSTFARQYFESAVTRYPENGYLHHILGEIHLSKRDMSNAIICFGKALDLLPGLTSSYIQLAGIYKRENNWQKQVEILHACTKKSPEILDCYYALVDLYLEKGQEKEARQTLETAFSHNKNSPILANNLAYLYLKDDYNISKAFELARFAYEYLPETPSVIGSFGWAYYKKKFYSQSVSLLKKACILSPKNPIPHYHLGQALIADGQLKKGLGQLQKAIDLNLAAPYREKAQTLIESSVE